MLNFNYYAPTYYEFGDKACDKVGELVKRFGGSKVLIHYGGKSATESGLIDRVKDNLESNSISYVELGGVVANPLSDLVYEGIELCRSNGVDFILAVGGGSVIDSAKAIGAGLKYAGDFWDFFRDENRLVMQDTIPVGVILTIAAAGSEGSNSCVITNCVTKMKRGNIRTDVIRPVFAIMDPRLTMTLPSYQTASGIADIMVHVMERYFSNTENCIVTDNLCIAVLKSMLESGKKCIDEPNNYEARANVMWASTLAHNNLCGVDREQDWASHKIEHELSAKYNATHGAGLAVIVPRWMRYVSKKNPHKFYEFSRNLFNTDDIDEGINKLQEFWISLGLPSKLEEVGYKEEDLDYLVEHVDYTKDGYVGNYVKIYREDVRNIYTLDN